MKDTKLFTPQQVRKFFDILQRLERSQCKWYKGWYKNNPDSLPCQQEVFIERTVSKWFTGKYIILYNKGYKEFIIPTSIHYAYGYAEEIRIYYLDYTKPSEFKNMIIRHNDALRLEGEWCKDGIQHIAISTMVSLNSIPNKTFIFKAYDWSKYPKRVKKGTDPKEKIETIWECSAKTHKEAYEKKKKAETDKFMIGELIKIK